MKKLKVLIQSIKNFFSNVEKEQLKLLYLANQKDLQEAYTEACYRVWESGYVAGKTGIEPEQSWNAVAVMFKFNRQIDPKLKEAK